MKLRWGVGVLATSLAGFLGAPPLALAGVDPQACCLPNLSCVDLPAEDCSAQNGNTLGSGTTCANNGSTCSMAPVPAASTWGLLTLALLLAVAGSLALRRRDVPALTATPALPVFLVVLTLFAGSAAAEPGLRIQDSNGDGVRDIIVNPHTKRARPTKGGIISREEATELFRSLGATTDSPAATTYYEGGTTGTLEVLGVDMTWGNGPDAPSVPVRLAVCVNANPANCDYQLHPENYQESFTDVDRLWEGDTDPISLGATQANVVFRAYAAHPDFNAPTWTRSIYSNGSNAIVLSDGDNINDILLEPIPKTVDWSIACSGMDARKGGCKDATESMALLG